MWGPLRQPPRKAWVGLGVSRSRGAGPQHPSEQLEHFSFQIVYSRLFILLFWNKIYFMAYDLWPPGGRKGRMGEEGNWRWLGT